MLVAFNAGYFEDATNLLRQINYYNQMEPASKGLKADSLEEDDNKNIGENF